MSIELQNTNVNMDGLIEVLGKNLYSSPSVAIRELVQNAHDACTRRKLEQQTEESLFIRIELDPANQSITLIDNGSGLTYEEIGQYLATIGSGYTRLLRDRSNSEEMIGYFGLGFLSAYVIASKVEVVTTSYQKPQETWKFTSKGGKQFMMQPYANQPIGTRITLRLHDQFVELSQLSVLESLLSKYCCMLPVPIYLNQSHEAVNKLSVPWRQQDQNATLSLVKQRLKFASLFEHDFEPICTIPIPNDNDLNIRGLMWIQDSFGYATSDYRNVSVFIRNMFITHEGRDLLPLWAGFVGCVIESNHFTPTASREDLQKDDYFYQVQKLLSDTLIDGLLTTAKREPENWSRVLKRHNQSLIGAAINDDSLFFQLKHDIKLPTSLGELPIDAMVNKSDGKIFLRTDEKNNYEDILFKARMIPVASGYLFGVTSFCEKYATLFNKTVIELGTSRGNQSLFKPAETDQDTQDLLSKLFENEGDLLQYTQVEPSHLPMVIVEDKEVVLKRNIEKEETSKKVGSAALFLAKLHTNKIDDSHTRKVFINLDNQLIQKVIQLGYCEKSVQISQLLRAFTLTLCGDSLDDDVNFSQQLQVFCNTINKLI